MGHFNFVGKNGPQRWTTWFGPPFLDFDDTVPAWGGPRSAPGSAVHGLLAIGPSLASSANA